MTILLLTQGSRGDVQPMIALAQRLAQSGYTVTLGAPPEFAHLAKAYGIAFRSVGISISERLKSKEGKAVLQSDNIFRRIRFVRQLQWEMADKVSHESWQAAQGAHAVLYWTGMIAGYTVAEKLGIPCAEVAPFPARPTRAFSPFLIGGGKDRGPHLNRLMWQVNTQIIWQLVRRGVNEQRRMLDLPPFPLFGPHQVLTKVPVFHAYSPGVVPRPADWPEQASVTGFFYAEPPPNWQPPAPLCHFLEQGAPPVYIGFGSMPDLTSESTRDLIIQALTRTNQRGVVQQNLIGDGALPETIHAVDSIPHSWLFPRMAAAVHHGGAGTTAMALRSGIPSIIKPVSGDQPAWARQVQRLGVGPAPLPRQGMRAEQLADAITITLNDARMRQRASDLGRSLRAEDGLQQTTELFTRYITDYPAGRYPIRRP
jgi:sterol 3beta-glucosyltransferase